MTDEQLKQASKMYKCSPALLTELNENFEDLKAFLSDDLNDIFREVEGGK